MKKDDTSEIGMHFGTKLNAFTMRAGCNEVVAVCTVVVPTNLFVPTTFCEKILRKIASNAYKTSAGFSGKEMAASTLWKQKKSRNSLCLKGCIANVQNI